MEDLEISTTTPRHTHHATPRPAPPRLATPCRPATPLRALTGSEPVVNLQ